MFSKHFFVRTWVAVSLICEVRLQNRRSKEKDLMKEIFKRFTFCNKLQRPSKSSLQAVNVSINFMLEEIISINVITEILTARYLRTLEWVDDRLKWDASYNIEYITLPVQDIWYPELTLINSESPSYDMEYKNDKEQVTIYKNGSLFWISSLLFNSVCNIDLTYFPRDSHICELIFVSPLNKKKVFFTWKGRSRSDEMVLFIGDDYMNINSSNWIIHAQHHYENDSKYFPEKEYQEITLRLRIRRKFIFHLYMILFPIIALVLMSSSLVWVPPQRPDRTSLGTNILNAFLTMLLLLMATTPPKSVVRLGVICCGNIICAVLQTLYSAIIINVIQPRTQVVLLSKEGSFKGPIFNVRGKVLAKEEDELERIEEDEATEQDRQDIKDRRIKKQKLVKKLDMSVFFVRILFICVDFSLNLPLDYYE